MESGVGKALEGCPGRVKQKAEEEQRWKEEEARVEEEWKQKEEEEKRRADEEWKRKEEVEEWERAEIGRAHV